MKIKILYKKTIPLNYFDFNYIKTYFFSLFCFVVVEYSVVFFFIWLFSIPEEKFLIQERKEKKTKKTPKTETILMTDDDDGAKHNQL